MKKVNSTGKSFNWHFFSTTCTIFLLRLICSFVFYLFATQRVKRNKDSEINGKEAKFVN